MAFEFDESQTWNWHWLELVAQLNDESIAYVVNGPNNRSGGMTECWLSMQPGSYDHKRHHQLQTQGQPIDTRSCAFGTSSYCARTAAVSDCSPNGARPKRTLSRPTTRMGIKWSSLLLAWAAARAQAPTFGTGSWGLIRSCGLTRGKCHCI